MSGIDQLVKRAWSLFTSHDGSPTDPLRGFFEQINALVADVETLKAYNREPQDSVVNVEFVATAGCGLAVDDGDDADLETNRTVVCSYRGARFTALADDAADVSAILGTGNTIGIDQFGSITVWGNRTASVGLSVSSSAQTELTDIAALAQEIGAAQTEGDVPIGCLMIEADSTLWEWGSSTTGQQGPDSDTETYYDLLNAPYLTSAMASFALDAAAATFTYGAAVGVLGSGTAITITGKANVAFPAGEVTAITPGNVGAFVLYCLADDDEIPLQITSASADIRTARVAVDDLRRNPLLVELGRIYIENDSAVDFTPGTTNLDATGITVTFETGAIRAAQLETTDLTASTMTTPESQD